MYLFCRIKSNQIKLLSCNAGCYINDMCINHVMYADDICLLAPSASAMQSLLDVCYDYGSDNDILFNPIKSVYTIFLFLNLRHTNCISRLCLLVQMP